MSDSLVVERFGETSQTSLNTLKSRLTAAAASRTPHEKRTSIEEAESCIRAIELQVKEFERERKHLDFGAKQDADRRIKSVQKELEDGRKQLKDFKQEQATENMNAAQQAEFREQRQKLLESRDIADSNSSSLQRTNRMIQESTAVSIDTSERLESQTERMESMKSTLKETDGVLDKSRMLLRRMRSRLVTNKMITAVIILLELGILALVIYIKYYS